MAASMGDGLGMSVSGGCLLDDERLRIPDLRAGPVTNRREVGRVMQAGVLMNTGVLAGGLVRVAPSSGGFHGYAMRVGVVGRFMQNFAR
jgi:hypothetical protein